MEPDSGGVHPPARPEDGKDASAGPRCVREGWLLAAIVLLAFLLRLTGFLDDAPLLTEGTTYVTLARNLRAGRGYVGILGGPDWFISPLYPLLITAVSYLTSEAELAGRLLSFVLGSLLPLPVYWLARQCFGRRAAWLAALIVAGTSVLVQYSSLVWSETTYTFLMFLGLALGWRALQSRSEQFPQPLSIEPRAREHAQGRNPDSIGLLGVPLPAERRRRIWTAGAAGLVLGCASLTRSEGVASFGLLVGAVVVLALLQGQWRQHLAGWASILAVLLAGFLLVTAPYVVALSRHSGQLTLDSKSRANFLVTARMETGLDYHQAAYGLNAAGEPAGPFLMREQILTQGWPADAPAPSLLGRLRHLLRNMRTEVTLLRTELFSSLLLLLAGFGVLAHGWDNVTLRRRGPAMLAAMALAFVVPWVLLPAWALGMILLFGDGWTWRRLLPLAYVAVFPLALLPVVALAPGMFTRYLMPLLPFVVILAALGVDRVVEWASGWPLLSTSSPRRRVVWEAALAATIVGAVLLSLPRHSVAAYQQEQGQAHRSAGLWLSSYDPSPDKRIMSIFSQVPYYAEGVHVPLPDGTAEQVASYARAQDVQYLVMTPQRLGSRPGLSAWQQGEAIPSDWIPIYQSEDPLNGLLTIYELPH
jgi:4-amino-4-deoxy-L-arabinose transferase-like glycosyltransferase